MCKEEEEVFSFGLIRLPRLAARCRGGSRRRGRSGRVWDLACIRFGCKKPHPSSIRCRGLRSSASDRSFAFGSARPSFLLSPPLNMYWVGWGGAQAFYPKEDNAAGLLICDSHPVSNIILGLSCQPCKPAGLPGWLRSVTMNKLDVNSDMYRIVGCALAVYNHLKPGYLESVYEKALEKELTAEGFAVRRQVKLPVYYKGELLDAPFVADMIVNDAVLVELKAVSNLAKIHERQVESYLKSTGMESGLLVNFGNLRRLEWRVVTL